MSRLTLASLTSLRLGGPIGDTQTIADPSDWPDFVRTIKRQGQEAPLALGHGSNVIASDAGHPGTVAVINTHGIAAKRLDDTTVAVTVNAGHPFTDLTTWAVAEHLAGIEYLVGIPGTVGAAPVQNTGAYGQRISDTLHHLRAWDWHASRMRTLPAQQCRLGHRRSRFKREPGRWTILSATLHLTRTDTAAPATCRRLADALQVRLGTRPPLSETTAAVLADRHRRGLLPDPDGPDARQIGSAFLDPAVTPGQAARWSAAGCPVYTDTAGRWRVSAGWLLELVGCHPGRKVADGIHCSDRRTLAIAARGETTAAAFAQVLADLAAQVGANTGIKLSPEPARIGQWPT
ncbi:UDP-N-acetylmuramate dehydrogenase [Kitasatospora sp. NPDC089509]|uniref:UDP-N-acetylmuramate dehydrogenase n=1 Tax=Kitasatospora sp. NPDC089509 TaxID=3364079 RepID=UPI0037FBEFC5